LLTDDPMVVGPEYGAITSVALGIDHRNGVRVRQGLFALTAGFSLAFSSWHEARGSFFQLLLNIVLLIVVGVLTLKLQRFAWRRISRRSALPAT